MRRTVGQSLENLAGGRPGTREVPERDTRPEEVPAPAGTTSADVFATSDRAVLTGLVAIKMALVPNDRPLLVNHWATWCDGCVEELDALVALRERWRGKLDVVGVGWETFQGPAEPAAAIAAVETVAEAHGIDWPTLIFDGPPPVLFDGLGLEGHTIPQTHLLDSSGKTVLIIDMPLDEALIAQLDAALESLSQ